MTALWLGVATSGVALAQADAPPGGEALVQEIEQELASGAAALELAEVERAESSYRRALELAQTAQLEPWVQRAHAAVETLPASAIDVVRGRIGDDAPPLDGLRRAAELGPLARDEALLLAVAERDAGRLAASNHQLRSLVERFASTTAQLELARNAAAFGNRKVAFDHARRAADEAPYSPRALRVFVRLGLDAGLASAVAPSVETLARLEPDDAEVAFLTGRMWTAVGDSGEASEALLRATTLDPDHVPARRALGLALADERRFAEARAHLEAVRSAADESADDLELEATLAEVELQLGEADAATARAHRVLEQSSRLPRALFVLGLAANRSGDFDAARGWLERAVTVPTAPPRAHYQLSIACSRLGDRACAEEHLEIYRRMLEASESPLRAAEAPTLMQRKTPARAGGETSDETGSEARSDG
ncbi:MAG: tetratricopeptide repeat protein [Acidobacteriota bacterium]